MTSWQMSEYSTKLAGWGDYVDHLKRVNMRYSTLNQSNTPRENYIYYGLTLDTQVIGHIAVEKQAIIVPASSTNQHEAMTLTDAKGNILYELFVCSFAVENGYRRQGYGRALQELALQKAHDLGCYQMRSWSHADAIENYALKLSMGFTVHPALYPMPNTEPISGVYFIQKIHS